MARETPVIYLKHQLSFTMSDWQSLTIKDKEDLKKWAEDEQDATENSG